MDSLEIKTLLKKMTLEEKLTFLTGADAWHTVGFQKLGIPQVTVSDGPHGLRKVGKTESGKEEDLPAIGFPTASALAATWNPAVVQKVGRAIAGECIDNGVDIILGPGVNMKRSPLCGRNFEYFSEDPYLAGQMGTAYVQGVQSRGIGTCLKHFAANSQETDRFCCSSEMDERTLREIYLRAFETVVKEAKPWTVMCAYNRLNGVHCSQNSVLLDNILRKEWGFEGAVISDWGAVHDRPAALRASLELEMPFSKDSLPALKKAYDAGEITDGQIDRAVASLLRLVNRVQQEKPKRKSFSDTAGDRLAVARDAASEAITLLKNEDGILPIQEDQVRKIAVIGGCAKTPFIQGGGSSRVTVSHLETPLEAIQKTAGDKVSFAAGYQWGDWAARPEVTRYKETLDTASEADVVLVFVGESEKIETEGTDRSSIRLDPCMEQLILDVSRVNPNTVAVVQAGSAIDMSCWIGAVKGVLFNWYAGCCGAGALADILFGRVNPSGKLSETFPWRLEDTPAYGEYPGLPVACYGEGVFTGYRYYDTVGKDVLFPFGYGLSYTEFAYSDLKISSDQIAKNGSVEVSLCVKNTGSVSGKETVQLYISDAAATVRRPEKELKRFEKISLKSGEKKTVSFTLTWRDFAFYSAIRHAWDLEEGPFKILIGASSRDIRLSAGIRC
jgi:beta-glucosidase